MLHPSSYFLCVPTVLAFVALAGCTQPVATGKGESDRVVVAPPAARPAPVAKPALPADCTHPFGLDANMELVYALTDGSGKPAGELRSRVVRLSSETNKKQTVTTYTVLVKSGLYDEQKRLQHLQDLTYGCRNDTSFTDGMAEIHYESLKSFRDRRLAYTPTALAWPNQPTVGSQLPAGGISIQVSSSVVDIAKVYTKVSDRRIVGGLEAVSTPAGTFQCYRVEAQRETAVAPHADLVMRTVGRVIDYYSPAVGIVKTELYGKNNKLEQTRLLAARNGAE